MNILITGAKGFVGRNLTEALKAIRDGKDRTHPELTVGELYCCDIGTEPSLWKEAAAKADFVFHLAGVNRPKDPAAFMEGNRDLTAHLLSLLRERETPCRVMYASSIQATLIGRYDGEYGRSKRAGEELLFAYERETGARALVYRFPNLFGKWCHPNYNSAVATFCHNIAHDLPITVSDPSITLELLYIDDLIDEMLLALRGNEHRCEFDGTSAIFCENGRYCAVPTTHRVTLGEITALLQRFAEQPRTLRMPSLPCGSFEKKLYSTYLSYLPKEKAAFSLAAKSDERGSFTEFLKTADCGQFSVNISEPGVTKGQHWHHSKWELFLVVSGEALIRMRRIGEDEVIELAVSGDRLEAVHMLPGYTHSIINRSQTERLITLMWANEPFDPSHPDTFYEEV